MTTNETKIQLLQESRQSLRYLHAAFGYDFQAPHEIIYLRGSYTVNKLRRLAESAGYGEDAELTILTRNSDKTWYNDRRLHVVRVIDGQAEIKVPAGCCQNGLDDFIRKADFEYVRKGDAVTYLVCQRREHLNRPKAAQIDKTDRYAARLDWPGHYTLTSLTTGKKYEYAVNTYAKEKIEDVLDRSGYFVKPCREELRRRAAALRAQREKAAYLETDNAWRVRRLETLIERKKLEIAERLVKAETREDFSKVEQQLSYFHGLGGIVAEFERYRSKTQEKAYRSIEESDRAYRSIEQRLTA